MISALATSTTAAQALAPGHWVGPGPWWPIIPFLWFFFLVAVFATFAFFGRRRWRYLNAYAGHRAGEARLAERYAAGEIDEAEYERRLTTLKRFGSS